MHLDRLASAVIGHGMDVLTETIINTFHMINNRKEPFCITGGHIGTYPTIYGDIPNTILLPKVKLSTHAIQLLIRWFHFLVVSQKSFTHAD